jgi:hypothetical protein
MGIHHLVRGLASRPNGHRIDDRVRDEFAALWIARATVAGRAGVDWKTFGAEDAP